MHQIDVASEEKVLKANMDIAQRNENVFEINGVLAVDLTGAIGSGKTLLIERMIEHLKGMGISSAAIAGDSTGTDDSDRFKTHDIPVENINTGKECHLDAHLIEHALEHMDLSNVDVLFIENVGNLLCPSDFPLGTHLRLVVVSTTEGDDMVRKHPNIFSLADAMVLNKVDLARFVEVDTDTIVADFERIAPHGTCFLTDARTNSGVPELIDFILSKREQ